MLASRPPRLPPPPSRRLTLAAAAPSSFPPYSVVARKEDAYDLRLYAAHAAVVTRYTRRDEGFAKLGGEFGECNVFV